MKILICNSCQQELDETAALVKAFCEKTGAFLEVHTFQNPVDAAVCRIKFDIAVVDTETTEISGIALGKILQRTSPYIKLIFTASNWEALDAAFDVNAVRYLVKPYTDERFCRGLENAIYLVELETVCFDFRDEDGIQRINKNDILYVEIVERKTKIVTRGQTYYSRNPMSYWRDHLHSVQFLKPHKSYYVNANYIFRYKRNSHVVMLNGDTISVARSRGAAFHTAYTAYKKDLL